VDGVIAKDARHAERTLASLRAEGEAIQGRTLKSGLLRYRPNISAATPTVPAALVEIMARS